MTRLRQSSPPPDTESIDMETSVALDFLGDLRRTHMCGDLRAADAGQTVLLMGWAHRRRDHGSVIFIDMRDRTGHTQAIFHEDVDAAVHNRAEEVRAEYVIAVEGVVALRSKETVNPNRSEEHTSELQSLRHLVCRLLLEKNK